MRADIILNVANREKSLLIYGCNEAVMPSSTEILFCLKPDVILEPANGWIFFLPMKPDVILEPANG